MTPENFHNLYRTEIGLKEGPGAVEEALRGLERTIKAVRDLGKTVVVIAPPPAMDWDAGRCAERLIRNMPIFGADADCTIKNDEYQSKRRNVLYFLDEISRRLEVDVISFDAYLKAGDGCKAIIDGEIIYISNGYPSYRGSLILAEELKFRDLIETHAKQIGMNMDVIIIGFFVRLFNSGWNFFRSYRWLCCTKPAVHDDKLGT